MRYLWIAWMCLVAAPLAVAQQHTQEPIIEAPSHETMPHAVAPGHIPGENGPTISHQAVPHSGGESGAMTIAATALDEPRTYLGVRLDPEPLPELLVKHLRLDPETGLRVQNVLIGSPADTVGLEQDDLIMGLNGKPVRDIEKFVETIRTLEAGKSVELKIVHLGERKIVKATLETSKPGHEEWKYPQEPEISYSWNPGRVFRMQPGQKNWLEVPMEKMPDVNSYVKKFMQEMYSFSHSEDGKNYTVTIEGSPADPQTQITVKSDETEISTTVEKIGKLPEPFRTMAKKDLDSALKSAKTGQQTRQHIQMRSRMAPPVPAEPIEPFTVPAPPKAGGESMDKLQKEMKSLQKRLEQMEQEQQKSMEKLQKEMEKMNQAGAKPAA
jgi:hypothetical protein